MVVAECDAEEDHHDVDMGKEEEDCGTAVHCGEEVDGEGEAAHCGELEQGAGVLVLVHLRSLPLLPRLAAERRRFSNWHRRPTQ